MELKNCVDTYNRQIKYTDHSPCVAPIMSMYHDSLDEDLREVDEDQQFIGPRIHNHLELNFNVFLLLAVL